MLQLYNIPYKHLEEMKQIFSFNIIAEIGNGISQSHILNKFTQQYVLHINFDRGRHSTRHQISFYTN